jgi:hypothetical protein
MAPYVIAINEGKAQLRGAIRKVKPGCFLVVQC